jgi:glycosyltransferase involved in cell wall biosynthesis
MTFDTPIVSSAQPAVREAVGDAAVLVDAGAGGESWAAAVAEALRRRQELVTAGRIRRQRFTLEASGSALAGAYRQAACG